jgi:hypothetical protein
MTSERKQTKQERRDELCVPMTMDQVPEEISLYELWRRNGTRPWNDQDPNESKCQLTKGFRLPGFDLVGWGWEQVVYDAQTFVVKLQKMETDHYGHSGSPTQLLSLSTKYPDRYAKTTAHTIRLSDKKSIGMLVQEKLKSVPEDYDEVLGEGEYGINDRGKCVLFDWG